MKRSQKVISFTASVYLLSYGATQTASCDFHGLTAVEKI